MDRIAVLFPFVGIVVGLGLADLVFSVHRSVRAGRRWHWLPATWVAFMLLLIVVYWWIFAEVGRADALGSVPRFAFHLLTPLLLVLACAAALPDGGRGEPDLLAYYLRNRRYFFGLLALLFAHMTLDYGLNYGSWGRPQPWVGLGFAAAMASLAVVGRPSYHRALTVALIVAMFAFIVALVPTL